MAMMSHLCPKCEEWAFDNFSESPERCEACGYRGPGWVSVHDENFTEVNNECSGEENDRDQ